MEILRRLSKRDRFARIAGVIILPAALAACSSPQSCSDTGLIKDKTPLKERSEEGQTSRLYSDHPETMRDGIYTLAIDPHTLEQRSKVGDSITNFQFAISIQVDTFSAAPQLRLQGSINPDVSQPIVDRFNLRTRDYSLGQCNLLVVDWENGEIQHVRWNKHVENRPTPTPTGKLKP